MTPNELAAQLNGREYGHEITPDEARQAKADGLVVVFGYSDDNMELRGAIDNEIDAYEGGTAYLTADGLLTNDCDNDDCPHFAKLKALAATIDAKFDSEGYTWTYETAIPHTTFEIVEGDEKYCRGIVFALADVAPRDGQGTKA
jgi:hypothetical protein